MTFDEAYVWYRNEPNALQRLLEMKCEHEMIVEENAKLREQADFEHFQLGELKRAAGMMLDDYSALLNEHNRLRKLSKEMGIEVDE